MVGQGINKMDNFSEFAKIVADSFQSIVKQRNVFVVGDKKKEEETEEQESPFGEKLFQSYLDAFPEGTNPLFKKRTEHDCSCCKQFIRRAGNVIIVNDNGTIETVWSKAAKKAPEPYNKVASALNDIIINAAITNIFRVGQSEASFGNQNTRSVGEGGKIITWHHFYTGEIPKEFRSATPDQERGNYRTTVQVFERGLRELKSDAVDTVLGLISAKSLYRGEEFGPSLLQFQQAQHRYKQQKTDREREVFAWTNAFGPASRFRNTVMGTLIQDLSESDDLELSVAMYESKVAPANYKRPTALITPGMVKKAMETLQELDLESALERRFARIEDISVKDVLWVNNKVKPLMKGGIAAALFEHVASTKVATVSDDEKRAENISLNAFIKDIVPQATGIDLYFKSEHLGNLMSLTAPVHPEPKQLFRWTNDFAWSYGGNVADSIKERVKKAGGNVTNAKLRVSLSWFNTDDLDLHVYDSQGDHIFFGAKHGRSGGALDVDMNVSNVVRNAVENVSWVKVPDGPYRVVVNNYRKRESIDVGFVIEIENEGKLSHFTYNKAVQNGKDVDVVTLHIKSGKIEKFEKIGPELITTAVSQEKWGLHTEDYIAVNAITLSPNYWGDNAVGNKHTFFVLEGAKNDEPTRGIYNEFLHPRLEQHRKVFEIIGEKTKCQPTENQLSGLGFSSTKRDSFLVRVTQDKKQRIFNVQVAHTADVDGI